MFDKSFSSSDFQLVKFHPQLIPEMMSWFTTAQAVVLWAGYNFTFPFSQNSFHSQLKLQSIPAYALLESKTNKLVGFGQLMSDGRRCHLVRIAVNPEFRGKGLGQILLRALMLKGIRLFEPEAFSLFVNKSNQSAIHLYQKLGFKISQYHSKMPNEQSWYMLK